MIISALWEKMPGHYFCISTKDAEGAWKDNFFTRSDLHLVRQFVTDHLESDIYFCPHGFSRRQRRKDAAVMPPMCWADLDDVNPHKLEIKPTIAIESSPGRYVGLWLTNHPIDEDLNRRLTYHLKADKGGWDVTQVLRVPGTFNYKYEEEPRVKLLWDDGPSWTISRLEKLLPATVKGKIDSDEAAALFDKYSKGWPPWLRRELLSGKPKEGKRSEMIWKIENALLESGLDTDDVFILVKSSPWNKFKGRSDEDDQLERELAKAVRGHFSSDEPRERAPKPLKNGHDVTPNEFLGITMDVVEEEELDWVWYPYLAKGELTILEGDPGLGKSYLAQMVCSSIADGKRLPTFRPTGHKPAQGRIMVFDIENSPGTVTKRRLTDNTLQRPRNYIQVEKSFSIDDEEALVKVHDAIAIRDPLLVVFDTLNTYIGKADTHKASETTQAIGYFRELAKEFNCAVLVLRHLTKSHASGLKALYRGQGSIAFTAMARVVMTVGHMPDDEDVKVMAVTKINVTKPPPALCFTVDERPNDHSKFAWGDFVNLSSEEILERPKAKGEKLGIAEDWLESVLEDGPVEIARVKRMAEKRSISVGTMNRAAESLGLQKVEIIVAGKRQAAWQLP